MVCPMKSAYDLVKVYSDAELIIVPDAGHSAKEVTKGISCRSIVDLVDIYYEINDIHDCTFMARSHIQQLQQLQHTLIHSHHS